MDAETINLALINAMIHSVDNPARREKAVARIAAMAGATKPPGSKGVKSAKGRGKRTRRR